MDYQITTAPAHEPVSLEQAKRHLRIDDTASDSLLRSYLRAARLLGEDYTGRAFLWQTIEAKMSGFPVAFQLPRPPLIAVRSISYVDTAGTTQTVDSSVYDVDTTSEPGKVLLAYDEDWPSDLRAHHHDVTVTYIAGHAVACTRSLNTLVVPGHRYEVNDVVQVYNIDGALPAGLSAGTTYYVTAVSGTAVSLATTEGGTAVTITGDGTGTHYIDALPECFVNGILLALTRLWLHRGDDGGEISAAEKALFGMRRMVSL